MAGPKLFVIYRPNSYDGLFTTSDTTVLGVCLWEGMVVALTRARLRCSTLWISRGGRPLEIDCHHRWCHSILVFILSCLFVFYPQCCDIVSSFCLATYAPCELQCECTRVHSHWDYMLEVCVCLSPLPLSSCFRCGLPHTCWGFVVSVVPRTRCLRNRLPYLPLLSWMIWKNGETNGMTI